MPYGRKLRALKLAFAKAALRLRLKWLKRKHRARLTAVLTMVSAGTDTAQTGVNTADEQMTADGITLVLRGWTELMRMGIKP